MLLAGDVSRIINQAPGMRMFVGTFTVSKLDGADERNCPRKPLKAVRSMLAVGTPEKEKICPDQVHTDGS